MVLIDYGALLRVDGKFINKNCDVFDEISDTGYICDKALYPEDNQEYDIKGNFFVYAGDENFLVCFYKTQFIVISKEKIILWEYYHPFLKETFYLDGLSSITIEYLEKRKTLYYDPVVLLDKDFYISYYGKKKGILKYHRLIKRKRRNRKEDKYFTSRFLASWQYNGKKYEVIFGYGIDPNKEIWDDIRHKLYNFTDKEREIIDSWFEGEMDYGKR